MPVGDHKYDLLQPTVRRRLPRTRKESYMTTWLHPITLAEAQRLQEAAWRVHQEMKRKSKQ
jgi:hypothetical protein